MNLGNRNELKGIISKFLKLQEFVIFILIKMLADCLFPFNTVQQQIVSSIRY